MRTSIINTLLFTVLCLVFQFMIGFLLALFFNRRFFLCQAGQGIADDALDDTDHGDRFDF